MPKSKQPKTARVAPTRQEEPLRPVPVALIMEERDELARILVSPAFIKAMRNARCMKPTAFVAAYNTGRGAQDALQICNDRLREIRGWEAFEFALFAQVNEPVQRVKPVAESFPMGGTIDAAFKEESDRTLPKIVKPKAVKTI